MRMPTLPGTGDVKCPSCGLVTFDDLPQCPRCRESFALVRPLASTPHGDSSHLLRDEPELRTELRDRLHRARLERRKENANPMAAGSDPDAPDWFDPAGSGDDDVFEAASVVESTDGGRSEERGTVHSDDLPPDGDVRGSAMTADFDDDELEISEVATGDTDEPEFTGEIPGFSDWREELRERLKRIRARREQERLAGASEDPDATQAVDFEADEIVAEAESPMDVAADAMAGDEAGDEVPYVIAEDDVADLDLAFAGDSEPEADVEVELQAPSDDDIETELHAASGDDFEAELHAASEDDIEVELQARSADEIPLELEAEPQRFLEEPPAAEAASESSFEEPSDAAVEAESAGEEPTFEAEPAEAEPADAFDWDDRPLEEEVEEPVDGLAVESGLIGGDREPEPADDLPAAVMPPLPRSAGDSAPELDFEQAAYEAPASAPELDIDAAETGPGLAVEWDSQEAEAPRPRSSAGPLGERAAAAVCDLLVLLAIGAALVWAAASGTGLPFRQILFEAAPWLALTWAIFAIGYSIFFVGSCGQTIGRMVMRLRVVGEDRFTVGFDRAAVRLAAWVVSALPLGAGLLPALRDPKRRAAHDRLSRTRVVKA